MGNGSVSSSERSSVRDEILSLTPLPCDFYERNTVQVAQDLLGKLLMVRTCPEFPVTHPQAKITVGRIVETEAYRGDDPASHSCRGETPRSSVMFGDPGTAYVYFIYGMYEMLNFVTEPKGYPGAVLIRAIEPILGENLMKRRRKQQSRMDLARGPGRLCQAMGIKMSHNRQKLCGPSLYVLNDGFQPRSISSSERIGIRLGTDKLWRFFVTGSPFVSRFRQNSMGN